MNSHLHNPSPYGADISTDSPLNATSTDRLDTSYTMKDLHNENSNCPSRAEALAEIAELTGEKYTLECRLQWVEQRLDMLRVSLAQSRKHGNSRER